MPRPEKTQNAYGNVLFVLSPLSPELISSAACASAATMLREKGASCADLTSDPRVGVSGGSHSFFHPVPEFSRIAQGMAEAIFRPVVGQSSVRDLTRAVRDSGIVLPDLPTLSTVGTIFARASLSTSRHHDGRNLGLVFYLAIHARTQKGLAYDQLVFPSLTKQARRSLGTLDERIFKEDLPGYGPVIDLNATRARMAALQTKPAPSSTSFATPQPKPRYLN